ncbi:TIGR03619 family F420-dependent LLM class oxidoreductase [Amycolatopsis echigonensis]|uniref:F420-dependent oxidoreductase n=1 Tax=Amycolatopsis echigonensis TaxID=2576905 RepID=A0A2N3WE29_9PSEU|nr:MULTISPECIES: TIGR03619 family F420-dependent LLM class oxidoreductase [Amycolatopsis]MBB2499685.1 TIGR03619 family F420-dependent LLM class oxidoreductase [Amycolatopsis echigonensis]PKV92156.1 putative F420-dependent oxidoreductase [Amycolatopsis niigatensis]
MTIFQLGLALPQYGKLADPSAIAGFAAEAERMGFVSLWVGDRVLTPVSPKTYYPSGTPERPYPPEFVRFVDPLLALTIAANSTETARLGSSTLNGPLYSPVLLARSLTSLDLLSGGRLDVGLGLSWLRDEYTAAGVPWEHRGARLAELVKVLRTLWTADPAGHRSERWDIPDSLIGLRPLQQPGPPVLLGGASDAALRRVGRIADGWLPAGLPIPMLRQKWAVVVEAAEKAGRDPESLRRVLRINPMPGSATATVEDVAAQLKAAEADGITEALVDVHYVAETVPHALELAGELHAAVFA